MRSSGTPKNRKRCWRGRHAAAVDDRLVVAGEGRCRRFRSRLQGTNSVSNGARLLVAGRQALRQVADPLEPCAAGDEGAQARAARGSSPADRRSRAGVTPLSRRFRLRGAGQTGQTTGAGAQPASTRIKAAQRMWIIYLEIALALAIAAFIVWFTWPRKRK